MKKFLSLILILNFVSFQALSVEDFKQLTLEEAIKLLNKQNLDLKSRVLDIDEAKNRIKAVNSLKNPDLNIFYNYGRAGDGNPQQIGLSGDIELFKRSARKNLAKVELNLVQENFSQEVFEKKMDLKQAYLNLVFAKSMLEVFNEQKKLYEDLFEITKKRDELDNAQDVDILQTEIALNQMITQLNSAKLKVKSARLEFNKILNFGDDVVYDVAEKELPLPSDITDGALKGIYAPDLDGEILSYEKVLSFALENRFDIKIAKHRQEVAEKALTVVSRQRIPDLTVMGGYAYQPSRYSDTARFSSGAYAGAALTNIPVLYTYKPEIKNAKIEVEQAELNYKSVLNKAEKEVKSAYEAYVTARENLNLYGTKLVKNSEELIRISKKSYAAGGSGLTSLIVMEQSYKSIIMGYMEALAQYYTSWIDLLREVNVEYFDIEEDL